MLLAQLAQLSAGFQSLALLLTSKLGPSGADSLLGGFVYILGPCGSFSCRLNTHRVFQSEVLRFNFPVLEPWVPWSVSLPSYSSQFIFMQIWNLPLYQPPPHPICQTLPCPVGQPPPCLPGPLGTTLPQVLSTLLPESPPLLSVDECFFFNSWLLDFHIV